MPALDPDDPRIHSAATTILAAASVMPTSTELRESFPMLEAAADRGYFLPDEDQEIRSSYTQYLAIRAALLSVLSSMEAISGRACVEWRDRLPAFVVALSSACLLVRQTRGLVELASSSRLLRMKLDEADTSHAVPRKTFTRLYRAGTDLERLDRFHHAASFYRANRAEFVLLEAHAQLGELIALIDSELSALDLDPTSLFAQRLRYRWYSFRRRYHSAWKNSVFGLFSWSGKLIADLRQPGIKPPNSPKRVTDELRIAALAVAEPGDVFVTRHDDALSNLFLPGYWPHAALHLGSESARAEIGLQLTPTLCKQAADPVRFLESKKDGVLLRPPEDTLAVDAFIILRPPLAAADRAVALARAIQHSGKYYDFVFDFRKSDRLACTELIYRAYHHCGPLTFTLKESGGRLCLPAEEMIEQSLKQGFKVVASCGIGSGGILLGEKAELALHSSRSGL